MTAADWLWLIICFCAGMFGGVVQNWRLHRRIYALELGQNQVEEALNRETKRRAATDRWEKDKAERMAAEIIERSRSLNAGPPAAAAMPRWWEKA
jgi:hypothetical protein